MNYKYLLAGLISLILIPSCFFISTLTEGNGSYVIFSFAVLLFSSIIALLLRESEKSYKKVFVISLITGLIFFAATFFFQKKITEVFKPYTSNPTYMMVFNIPNPYLYTLIFLIVFNIATIFLYLKRNSFIVDKSKESVGDELVIDIIRFTLVKSYVGFGRIVNQSFFYTVKLTNKAIYSYVLGIPTGKTMLAEIKSFKVIKNEYVGFSYFRQGIVITSEENGKAKKVIFFIWRRKLDTFIENLKKLGLKMEA